MKTLLWAVEVLALEVLLLWGYFAVVGEHVKRSGRSEGPTSWLVPAPSLPQNLKTKAGQGRGI
jgi:hypothetical protein